MMSTGVILAFGFSLSGGDSQMNTLIWYNWLGGVIIGTMIGENMVLEEHGKAGPSNVVITGRGDVVEVDTWVGASGKNGMKRYWHVRGVWTGQTVMKATRENNVILLRFYNNCYKKGHIAIDCTNEKACNNCKKTGHLACDCPNDHVCNLCNIFGHVARQCPKADVLGERRGNGYYCGGGGGYRDVICGSCHQMGHMSRDGMDPLMICHNCGGRGHMAYECPSERFMDHAHGHRRF